MSQSIPHEELPVREPPYSPARSAADGSVSSSESPPPPADHGRDAYLVLLGCALAQAPVWGMQQGSQLIAPSLQLLTDLQVTLSPSGSFRSITPLITSPGHLQVPSHQLEQPSWEYSTC